MIKISKVKTTKITNMSELLNYIAGIFRLFGYLLIGAAFLMTVGIIVLYRIKASHTINELVSSTNNVLQSSLASQTEVLINNLDFISYIRSGSATRKNNFNDVQVLLFSYLDSKLISAIRISQISSKQPIFETGTPSKLFLTIELCYLNDKFNSKFGNCYNSMTLFFSETEYIKRLHILDNKISACSAGEQCINFAPFANISRFQLFGNRFKISSFSTSPIELTYYAERPYIWLTIFIVFFILLCLIAYIQNQLLRSIINKTLINPLQEITDKFKKNDSIRTNGKSDYITELKSLVNVVVDGRQKAVEAEFVDVAKKITHNINSKVATLNAIISSKDIKKEQIIIAKRACVEIQERISTLLNATKPVAKMPNYKLNAVKSIHSWCLLDLLIQDVISQKQIEWANNQVLLPILFENLVDYQFIWVNISVEGLKDTISNLLNNSYEATIIKLNNSRQSNNQVNLVNYAIYVTIQLNKQNIVLKIQDSGCGIPKDKIDLVKKGLSLKPNGNGIGLSSAIKFFQSINGNLNIISNMGAGTQVYITIPLNQNYPKWMTDQIKIAPNELIIIVDDDEQIHQEWLNKCSFLRLRSKHFLKPMDFENWYCKNSSKLNNPTIIMDYEFDGQQINGLQLLNGKNIKNVYLFTSYAEEYWLQEIIEKTSYFLIPKSLLHEIKLVEYEG